MKITTLIPAYKSKYLVELLTSLRYQTVKPARILFSDDSPKQDFMAMLNSEPLKSAVADLMIEVVPGPRTGAYNNFRHLLKIFNGATDLFHFLLDDDIIFPSFYERHLVAHSMGQLPCVISRRWTALESGVPMDDLPVPQAVTDHPQRMLSLDADLLFQRTVGLGMNWLGEFSNATFRSELADEVADSRMDGISFAGLEDLGAFLRASLRGPVGYINEHLGCFRTSPEQNSANPMGRPMKLAFLAYIALAIAAHRLGLFTTKQCYAVLERVSPVIGYHYRSELDMVEICALMPRLASGDSEAISEFLALWDVFRDGAQDSF